MVQENSDCHTCSISSYQNCMYICAACTLNQSAQTLLHTCKYLNNSNLWLILRCWYVRKCSTNINLVVRQFNCGSTCTVHTHIYSYICSDSFRLYHNYDTLSLLSLAFYFLSAPPTPASQSYFSHSFYTISLFLLCFWLLNFYSNCIPYSSSSSSSSSHLFKWWFR